MVDTTQLYFIITSTSYTSSYSSSALSSEQGGNTSLWDVETQETENFSSNYTNDTNPSTNATTAPCFTSPYIRSIYPMVLPIMLVFCIFSVFLNCLIVLSTRWCRKPMTPTLSLSVSLALGDAFASLVLAIGLIINSLLPCVHNINLFPGGGFCFRLALEVLRLGGILITVLHLMALGINHWIGIIRPLHYAAIMTRRTAWVVTIISWFCPVTLISLYFSRPDQGFMSPNCQEYNFMDDVPWRAIFASSFFVPLIVMSLIYLHIYVIVRKHNQYRKRYQNTQQLQRNVKAVITTILILGTYILGWMPAIVWYLLVCKTCTFQLDQIQLEIKVPVSIVINTLIILKALVNPIIYAARMSDIKTALKKMRYDMLTFCFPKCFHGDPPVDPLERGFSKTTRSLCESRSLRASSRGSSSKRAGGPNSLNTTSRGNRAETSISIQGNSTGNGNNNQAPLEMSEWKK